jgi:hypothetical protein
MMPAIFMETSVVEDREQGIGSIDICGKGRVLRIAAKNESGRLVRKRTTADPSTHHPQAEENAWGPVRSG